MLCIHDSTAQETCFLDHGTIVWSRSLPIWFCLPDRTCPLCPFCRPLILVTIFCLGSIPPSGCQSSGGSLLPWTPISHKIELIPSLLLTSSSPVLTLVTFFWPSTLVGHLWAFQLLPVLHLYTATIFLGLIDTCTNSERCPPLYLYF